LAASLAIAAMAEQPRGGWSWARETVNRMAQHLSLSEQQKQQALIIYMHLEEETRPVEMKINQQRAALRAAVKEGAPEWQVDQLAGALGVLVGQQAALETKADARVFALLTSEQRQKWDQPFRGSGRTPRGR
jgi:Spy/CpxP family protein refolding chaperone